MMIGRYHTSMYIIKIILIIIESSLCISITYLYHAKSTNKLEFTLPKYSTLGQRSANKKLKKKKSDRFCNSELDDRHIKHFTFLIVYNQWQIMKNWRVLRENGRLEKLSKMGWLESLCGKETLRYYSNKCNNVFKRHVSACLRFHQFIRMNELITIHTSYKLVNE